MLVLGAARVPQGGISNQDMGWVPQQNRYHEFRIKIRKTNMHTFTIRGMGQDGKEHRWRADFELSGLFDATKTPQVTWEASPKSGVHPFKMFDTSNEEVCQ